MANRYYKVAQHIFKVAMPEEEQGIALPSYEPFVVENGSEDDMLFSLTIDDAFDPSERANSLEILSVAPPTLEYTA